MKKKLTMAAMTILSAIMLVAIMPVIEVNAAASEDGIIPHVTIAAPWDPGITITFTDVFETYYIQENEYESGIFVFISDTGSFTFSADVRINFDGGSPEVMEANRTIHRSWGQFDYVRSISVSELPVNFEEAEFVPFQGWNYILTGDGSYILIGTAESHWRGGNNPSANLRDIALTPTPAATQPATPPANDTTVTFNGQALNFDLPIITRGGRTFYPMRELLDALGAEVDWDQETRTAIGILGGNRVEFPIDSNTYYVNGQARRMDDGLTSFIEDGRTYIPVRSAAEGLGLVVGWDGDANTIIITSSN